MTYEMKEKLEDYQEKAKLMEQFIAKIVRGNGVYYDDGLEKNEVCAILAEIAADYSEKVSEILHSIVEDK